MYKSDLLEIIEALTEKECARLQAFLEIERSNLRQDAVRLIKYVLDRKDEKESSALSKIEAYNFLFPDQKWVDNKLEKLMSDALNAVRRFVAEEMARQQASGMRQQHFLQKFFYERGLLSKGLTAYKQILRSAKEKEKWSLEDYNTWFVSEYEQISELSKRNSLKDDLNIGNGMRALDEYYLTQYMWLLIVVLNQKFLTPMEMQPLFEVSIFDLHSPRLNWYVEKPLGELFKRAIGLLMKEEEEENIEELTDFLVCLRNHEDKINDSFLYLFETLAINIAIKKINKGDFAYLSLVFEIQKKRVESGRVYRGEYEIHSTEFISILTNALRLNELNWAKDFIESHKDRILGVMPSREYYEFALSNYYYYCKEYDKARKILMTSNYEDIQCRISARILEIKALFELSLEEKADHRIAEFLEDRVEAAILFFFRLTEAEPRKRKMAKKFSDTVKRIIHAFGKRDIDRLEKIAEDIKASELIAERLWLLAIIERLVKLLKGNKD